MKWQSFPYLSIASSPLCVIVGDESENRPKAGIRIETVYIMHILCI